MLETSFIDAGSEGVMSGRPVPVAIAYGIVEGFQCQSLIQGVGLGCSTWA